MNEPRMMAQVAPYPETLAELVAALTYRQDRGWKVWLEDDLQRDHPGVHTGEARGMTLVVQRRGPDAYHPADLERDVRVLLKAVSLHVDELPAPVAEAAEEVRQALRQMLTVNHYFIVPATTYDEQSWRRWLFDRLGDVDTHERMEDFVIGGDHPLAPIHKPGADPYAVHDGRTWEEADTDFRGHRVHPD